MLTNRLTSAVVTQNIVQDPSSAPTRGQMSNARTVTTSAPSGQNNVKPGDVFVVHVCTPAEQKQIEQQFARSAELASKRDAALAQANALRNKASALNNQASALNNQASALRDISAHHSQLAANAASQITQMQGQLDQSKAKLEALDDQKARIMAALAAKRNQQQVVAAN